MGKHVKYGRLTNAQVDAHAKINESKADFGWGGMQRGNEAYDRVQRQAWPAQFHPRAAFANMVGEPVQLKPGDHNGAHQVLSRILRAIEKGGWTRGEWNRLYSMRDKWKERAEGRDHRFNTAGNRQGGLTAREAKHVKTLKTLQQIMNRVTQDAKNTR